MTDELPIVIETAAGSVRCIQFGDPARDAAPWVFGAGGGFGGPAGGVYARLAHRFLERNIASLCVDYRQPGRLGPCVADLIAGVEYFRTQGATRMISAVKTALPAVWRL